MYSNSGQIGPQKIELVALEDLTINPFGYNWKMMFPLFLFVYLLENYSKYFDGYTCWLSGERSLPFDLLIAGYKDTDEDCDRISVTPQH